MKVEKGFRMQPTQDDTEAVLECKKNPCYGKQMKKKVKNA